ncbi:MAG: TetR/AcrR family transcriptional regulator [Candidatus Acidiferrales bacterium]
MTKNSKSGRASPKEAGSATGSAIGTATGPNAESEARGTAEAETRREAASGRRRSPVQERSHGTVQRIFEVTSRLLADAPIEEITTSLIAREAGISVGALYRFFPDKQAIIDAIAVRHMEAFRAEFESGIGRLEMADGPGFLGAVIDAFFDFLESRPDFRTIALGRHISGSTRRRETDPNAVGAGMVKRFMIETLGMQDATALDLRLRVAIETGERLFAFAFEQPAGEERLLVIAEMKTLLAGYLFSE